GVVALRIGPQFWVVALGSESKRRAAAPAPDELGGQQLLVLWAGSALAQILAEGRHARVQLAHDHVRAVAPQHRGLRHRPQVAGLILVAQDELAGFERRLVRVGARDAAALDGGLADAILETKRLALVGQRVDILAPE